MDSLTISKAIEYGATIGVGLAFLVIAFLFTLAMFGVEWNGKDKKDE